MPVEVSAESAFASVTPVNERHSGFANPFLASAVAPQSPSEIKTLYNARPTSAAELRNELTEALTFATPLITPSPLVAQNSDRSIKSQSPFVSYVKTEDVTVDKPDCVFTSNQARWAARRRSLMCLVGRVFPQ